MNRRFQSKFAAIIPLLALSLTVLSVAQTTKPGEGKEGWLGVSISDVTTAQAKKMEVKESDGAYVNSVSEKSPAEAAGIKKGDIIIEFSGRKVFDADDLSKVVKRTKPETKTSLTVLRDKSKKTLQVTVGTMPDQDKRITRSFQIATPRMAWFTRGGTVGLKLIELNSQLAEYFGVPDGEGVLVEEVRKDSPAQKAGFKAGDVILRWGSKRVDEVSDIQKSVSGGSEGDNIEVELLRKGTKQKLTVVLEGNADRGFRYEFFRGHEPQMFEFRHPGGEEYEHFLDFESIKPKMEELKIKIEDMTREMKEKDFDLQNNHRNEIRRIFIIKEI